MKKQDQIERLIKAAIRYAGVAERHLAHSEWRSVDATATVVFDYQGVHQDLVKAVKPFKSLKKYSV